MTGVSASLDVRPVVVGYVTAIWSDQPEVAEQIVREMQLQVSAQGGSPYEAMIDLLDTMSDMVLMVASTSARCLGVDSERFIADTLAAFGRMATEE